MILFMVKMLLYINSGRLVFVPFIFLVLEIPSL